MRRFLVAAALAVAAAPLSAQTGAPPLGEPKDFRLPPSRTFTLPNGLRVTLLAYGTTPKAAVQLTVRAGTLNHGPGETWLAQLAADMLSEGTTTRSAARIAEEMAGMGGNLSINAGADQTILVTDVLGEHAPAAIALIADVAQRPLMPASEFARVLANKQRELALELSQPANIANKTFRTQLFGDHPYARIYPTEAELAAHTVEKVRRFWTENSGARRAQLHIVGRFDAAAVEQAVRAHFGAWRAGAAPLELPPQPSTRRSFALIDRPGAVQSTIMMGVPMPDPSKGDWVRRQVTDYLLGGSFSSRITTNIREEKGYTYSPYSQLSARYRTAFWVQNADVTTDVTGPSFKEIFSEIERLRREPPSADELRGIQNGLVGLHVIRNSSRLGIANQLDWADLHGLGRRYLDEYVSQVMKVTPADVQKTAQRELDPAKMTIVVVGDESKVKEQVQPYRGATP